MKWWKEIGIILIISIGAFIIGYNAKKCPDWSWYEKYTYKQMKYFEEVRPYLPELWNGEIEAIVLRKNSLGICYKKKSEPEDNIKIKHFDWVGKIKDKILGE